VFDVAAENHRDLCRSVGAGRATMRHAGVEVLRQPLDGAALPGRVAAFEDDDAARQSLDGLANRM
jgi:hypothetical protein